MAANLLGLALKLYPFHADHVERIPDKPFAGTDIMSPELFT